MKYLIRGDIYQSDAPNYRGTYRKQVLFADQFDESHPINQLFLTYLSKGDRYNLLNDLALAKEV